MASDETYKAYKEAHPNSKINRSTFLKIIRRYNESIVEYCLDTGRMAILPYGFGQIFVSKRKARTYRIDPETGKKYIVLGIDWELTKKHKKVIYHQNFHTEGYRFKWVWRYRISMSLKGMWILKMSRIASRSLAKRLKEDPHKYMSIYHEWQ